MRPSGAIELDERDRLFLIEYVQFGYMHHVIAAEALRSAYERAGETAIAMRAQVERAGLESARETAGRLNDGARVQTVAVARLLSELAAAIEDLGALLHAVRHRDRQGVMVEYLEATVSAVSDVLDLLLSRGAVDFPGVLNLPDLGGLTRAHDPGALEALRHDYENLGVHLAQAGQMYRERGPAGVATAADDVPPDHVSIVLGLLELEQPQPKAPAGLLARAHNKIKHRFSVIEDIAAFAPVGGQLTFAHYPRDQAAVLRLVHNITQVALLGAEVATLVLHLASRGREADG